MKEIRDDVWQEHVEALHVTQEKLNQVFDKLFMYAKCDVLQEERDPNNAWKQPHLGISFDNAPRETYSIELSPYALTLGEAAREIEEKRYDLDFTNERDLADSYNRYAVFSAMNTYEQVVDASQAAEEYYEKGNRQAFLQLQKQWREEATRAFSQDFHNLISIYENRGLEPKDLAKTMKNWLKQQRNVSQGR